MKKEPKPQVHCKYHLKVECQCIKPVETQADLNKRLHNQKVLKERFGIKV